VGKVVKGIIYAILAGAFITLQGVANASIGAHIGTWQAATLTQFTGFIAAALILLVARGGSWQGIRKVKPLYLMGGAFAAIIIFSEVTAIGQIGVTFTISALLIAQLTMTFLIDTNGWFDVIKRKMGVLHFAGIALMILGVIVLKL
jgi:transporter family-2 protein